MPSLKTNYIRTDITSECFRYEFQVVSNQPVDVCYYSQIESYFLSINPFIVFNYPFVYSTQQIRQLNSCNLMLSNGQKIQVLILINNTITLNSKQVASQIHRQLMKGTNLLYSQNLKICLNPFEEKKINYSMSAIPGFSLITEQNNGWIGFYLIPIEAQIKQFQSLSSLHENSIILDYSSGTFYQKFSIVRYDKAKQLIYFRTGLQVKKQNLKSLELNPFSGFQLAQHLSKFLKRLRQSQKLKLFIEKWQIKFDSRFMELAYNFFPASYIVLGKKEQKSLGECIGSISAFNFQHTFRRLLQSAVFDENMRVNIYFLLPKIYKDSLQQQSIEEEDQNAQIYAQLVFEEEKLVAQIVSEFHNLKSRMKLNDCRVQLLKYNVFVGWVNGISKTIKQIAEIVEKEKLNLSDNIFILSNYEDLFWKEKQTEFKTDQQPIKPIYKEIINYFNQNAVYYHLINFRQNDFKKYPDIVALKSFATIQSKLRYNPWKIKDIPFGTRPLMVFSLHIKHQADGSLFISVVGSLNVFLSKYTCLISSCTSQSFMSSVINVLKDCLHKFNLIHTTYPKRSIIYRKGDYLIDVEKQFEQIQQVLIQEYSCKATYILLKNDGPLRVYNQIDYNYISKDTVKSIQMLCQLKESNQRFIQLQHDAPMHNVRFLGIDQHEINFEEKLLQLTTKLCFTYQLMTEMKFGKGLGFPGYGEKLYNWAQKFSNTKGQQNNLKEGVLIFL